MRQRRASAPREPRHFGKKCSERGLKPRDYFSSVRNRSMRNGGALPRLFMLVSLIACSAAFASNGWACFSGIGVQNGTRRKMRRIWTEMKPRMTRIARIESASSAADLYAARLLREAFFIGGINITGHFAERTIRSAVLPNSARSSIPLPWIFMTSRSGFSCSSVLMINW
jgi:hypothetical protein